MIAKLTTAFVSLACASFVSGNDLEKLTFHPPDNMSRAEVYVARTVSTPKAVLVLCPGVNGDGASLAEDAAWIEFAREHDLGLLVISFASNADELLANRGYYYADQGSGDLLITAIRRAYGEDLQLILYGFSGGAHFTSRFVEWRPDRIIAWCAYSAMWWNDPITKKNLPPGIVACGDLDPRLGASLMYFKRGRAAGNTWLWIGVTETSHSQKPEVVEFARKYFAQQLNSNNSLGTWIDIDTEEIVNAEHALTNPSVTAWIPAADLLDNWKILNQP